MRSGHSPSSFTEKNVFRVGELDERPHVMNNNTKFSLAQYCVGSSCRSDKVDKRHYETKIITGLTFVVSQQITE